MPTGLDHQNGVIAVYRFGSTADGTRSASSDTDIAVLAQEPLSDAHRFDVQESLAARIGGDVDLIDLRRASPVLAIQVIAHGRLLSDDDSTARGVFEDRTFGAYARLNEERRGILTGLRKRERSMADDVPEAEPRDRAQHRDGASR